MPKRKPPAGNAVPEWIVTYGDMMSLLLCFFILLAAFSELKKPDEYQKVIDAIREALGADGGDSSVIEALDLARSFEVEPDGRLTSAERLRARSDVDEQSTDGADRTTATLFDGKRWTIGRPFSFEPGVHQLSDEGKAALRDLVAPRIRGSNNKFVVLGHAWGVEDRLSGYDSTELSYKRARSAFDYLVGECDVDPKLLDLWVAGDSQPLKVQRDPALDAGNRRVEVFMTEVTIDQLHPDPYGTGRAKQSSAPAIRSEVHP
ncbi:MAG TPA: flagellar motor protein MotB [Phycisphaerales bacterium]|nr:flagellar motor protein MotB [Phycisphaerales bacterium]